MSSRVAGVTKALLTLIVLLGWRHSPAGPLGKSAAAERLTVHEWGTFTVLQDHAGQELPGINIDDEPVPRFVHNLAPYVLANAFTSNSHWIQRMKGAPQRHPHVTMRLETPVLYFYPPPGESTPFSCDVHVQFRGGWLTEFYPRAEAEAPGLHDRGFRFSELTPQTIGELTWRDLQIGQPGTPPETDEHVWIAPRKTQSASLTAASGESEKYLFYRGVANLHAPLRIARIDGTSKRQVHAHFTEAIAGGGTVDIRRAWIVSIAADGSVRYQTLGPWKVDRDPQRVVAEFDAAADSLPLTGLDALRVDMRRALVADGLYEDEATAMLATWERAYFRSSGTRLFFTVPRVWTDLVLPLEISRPASIERVMMARIELITPEHEQLMDQLARQPLADPTWIDRLPASEAKERFLNGRFDFGDLGAPIPPDYQLYLKIGRFRNALLVHRQRQTGSVALQRFIEQYRLTPFQATSTGETTAVPATATR
ncbi:MAG: hypothetical protein U0939_25655 [Pirellulales bacterium]